MMALPIVLLPLPLSPEITVKSSPKSKTPARMPQKLCSLRVLNRISSFYLCLKFLLFSQFLIVFLECSCSSVGELVTIAHGVQDKAFEVFGRCVHECVCLRNGSVTHEDDTAEMLCLIPHLVNYIKYLLDMIEEILSDILFHDFVLKPTHARVLTEKWAGKYINNKLSLIC